MMRRVLTLILALSLTGCGIWDDLFSSTDKTAPVALKDITTTLQVREVWHTKVGKAGRYFFTPALVGDSIFAAGGDGTIERLNAATGAVIWAITTDDKLSAGVGATDTLVAVATVKGDILAFDGSGKKLWTASTNGEILSAPVVGQGLVITRTTDGRFLAFDAVSGARRWLYTRQPLPLVLHDAPGMVITQGTLIAGLAGGHLIALTLANGGLRWDVPVAQPKGATELERVADVTGTPVLSGNEVCVATFQGRAGCFDLATGNPIWARDISTGTGIGVDARLAFVSDEKSVVQAFSRSGGASVWKNDKLMYRSASTPASVGKAVAFGDYKGVVHWLSREDGQFIARTYTDDSQISAIPVLTSFGASPGLIFQTRNGGIYAFASE